MNTLINRNELLNHTYAGSINNCILKEFQYYLLRYLIC